MPRSDRQGEKAAWGKLALRRGLAALCAMVLNVSFAAGREVAPAAAEKSCSAQLAFAAVEDGAYTFDTGVLRGTLRQGGRSLGLSSVVHVSSGARLDRSVGILSYYRVFTTNKRHWTAAWDWPSASKLLPDGAVQIHWAAERERPFALTAVYRWKDARTLDVETAVKAERDLNNFEVFLASYFHEAFPSPYVYADPDPNAGFLLARKSYGTWQMFARSEDALSIIQDGRWKKEPNPVDWAIMPRLVAPVCVRRGTDTDVTVILMAPPEDCFAIATPYAGEGHYSLYLSLFGRDVKAGGTATARSRLVVTTAVSDENIRALYDRYVKELSTGPSWEITP